MTTLIKSKQLESPGKILRMHIRCTNVKTLKHIINSRNRYLRGLTYQTSSRIMMRNLTKIVYIRIMHQIIELRKTH